MIKDPYIGMPIVLGRPSKPSSNKPTADESNGSWQHTPTLPPGHPAVTPGTMLPPGHPNCTGGMNSSQEGVPDKTETSQDNPDNMSGTFDSMVLGSLPIAMAYTPMQQWKTTYSPSEALTIGTVFPELNLPFLGHQRRG